jgi:hypothetical protein
MISLERKREVANRCHIFGIPVNRWHSGAIFVYISRITCAPCKTSSDWIRVLVAVTKVFIHWALPFSTLQHTYNKTILIGWR